jgi:hypothetical protein
MHRTVRGYELLLSAFIPWSAMMAIGEPLRTLEDPCRVERVIQVAHTLILNKNGTLVAWTNLYAYV